MIRVAIIEVLPFHVNSQLGDGALSCLLAEIHEEG
jgi:hypothetical protein